MSMMCNRPLVMLIAHSCMPQVERSRSHQAAKMPAARQRMTLKATITVKGCTCSNDQALKVMAVGTREASMATQQAADAQGTVAIIQLSSLLAIMAQLERVKLWALYQIALESLLANQLRLQSSRSSNRLISLLNCSQLTTSSSQIQLKTLCYLRYASQLDQQARESTKRLKK